MNEQEIIPTVEQTLAKALTESIQNHLHFHPGSDKWWLQASVKNYLNGGYVSGSLYQAIEEIAKDYAFVPKHLAIVKQKKAEAKMECMKNALETVLKSLEAEPEQQKYGKYAFEINVIKEAINVSPTTIVP
jgi:hypothetical protein